MKGNRHCVVIAAVLASIVACSSGDYLFKTDYYDVQIDHFSFTRNGTFKMKYLYNDTYWDRGNHGPIFFYTGNEGGIEVFAQNTGFMWDIAPEFGALVIFAEHRYYGDSMPFGNQSFESPEKSGYLTSEQALADFAEFLTWFKKEKGAERSPVIAFGGSYGGMLTAWMRMKYPHIIQGGIAASAPIFQFEGMTPCNKYGQIVTADFDQVSTNCSETIRKSWAVFNSLGSNEAGRAWISKTYRLCKPLTNSTDVKVLKDWLTNVYGYLAMIDYPYPNSFLEPVPANPVKAVCEALSDSDQPDKILLKSIFKGVSIYFNYTGNKDCMDISDEGAGDIDAGGWDYQACTEMVMPMCYDGKTDFFEPMPWNYAEYRADCVTKFGVEPRPNMAEVIYGGRNIRAASNIVFSNGMLDPWYGGGVLESLSDTLIAVIIAEGAHHLDLRSSHPKDPLSVIRAREVEKANIQKWIDQYKLMTK